jgi:hypothetical protein
LFTSREIGRRRVDLKILSRYISNRIRSNFIATSKGAVASVLRRAIKLNFNKL